MLVHWAEFLGLSLNAFKCHKIDYFLPVQFLSITLSIIFQLLLQILSETLVLNFRTIHPLNYIFKNLKWKSFKILSFFKVFPLNSLKSQYCSLVRPLLKYGSVLSSIYGFISTIDCLAIKIIQRRFLFFAPYCLLQVLSSVWLSINQ